MAGFPNPFFLFSSPCGKEHILKGHKFRQILSGINSAEATGVQHGAGRPMGLWVLMVLHQHLRGKLGGLRRGKAKSCSSASKWCSQEENCFRRSSSQVLDPLYFSTNLCTERCLFFQKIIKLGSLQAAGLCLPSPSCSCAWQCLCFC